MTCETVQIRDGIWQCVHCKRKSRRNAQRTCTSADAKPLSCSHLGHDTGFTDRIRCTTCRGNVRKKFPIHACTYHGSCLPTVSASAETERMACAKCRAQGLGFEPSP